MVDTIYIEHAARDYPRAQEVLSRYPKARQIAIEKYSEVFNSHGQNFRKQKHNPSLILAVKNNKRVLSTPAQYETGGGANYYFSHMLNCLYDCRYCFLQGMYRSAHYLLFVNYQDFVDDIATLVEQHKTEQDPPWFFSGYDCDSLAYEPVTGFADYFLDQFKAFPNAVLELRTKSTQIRSLLQREALPNVVVAYSLSPQSIASSLELGAPSVEKRILALKKLQQQGWRIGIRFDPVVWHQDYLQHYQHLIDQVFAALDSTKIDSVTLGGFRLPKGFYKIMRKLHPDHWLFSAGLEERSGMIGYHKHIEQEAFDAIQQMTLNYISPDILYTYSGED